MNCGACGFSCCDQNRFKSHFKDNKSCRQSSLTFACSFCKYVGLNLFALDKHLNHQSSACKGLYNQLKTTEGYLPEVGANEICFDSTKIDDDGVVTTSYEIRAGCYVVLPVLGPSTARDTFGSFMNVLGGDPYYNLSVHGNNQHLDQDLYMTTKIISGIDFRAKNLETIDNLEKNSMDFYASVRSLYLQDRQQKIRNSDPTIDIMYEGDWEEVETQ